MPALNTQGIILRKYFLRETSYILIVFTREFGKIRGVLKGARNPYPQFAGNFEIFTQCDLLFYRKKKKGMDLITGCEALDFFLPVRKDIERLTYANYFIELTNMVTADNDPNEKLYMTLLEGLKLLAAGAGPKRTGRIFELRLLDAVGMGLQLDRCAVCGSTAETVFFSVENGGLICPGCAKKHRGSFAVSKGTLNFMRKIYNTPFSRIQQVKVSRDVGKETEMVLDRFLRYHIGGQMRSLKFLGEIEKKGIINV